MLDVDIDKGRLELVDGILPINDTNVVIDITGDLKIKISINKNIDS